MADTTLIWQVSPPPSANPAAERLRCLRCNGPLFMDEEEIIRYDYFSAGFDRRPRGGSRRGGASLAPTAERHHRLASSSR